jgi:ABC-type bacteriocin/lantibiotic exporter with double-glycine peptidase domain
MLLAPLSAVPLELQRRIIDDALSARNLKLLTVLGALYFFVVCIQGVLKYLLNMAQGLSVETVARALRLAIVKKNARSAKFGKAEQRSKDGTTVAMLAAETEDLSGFAGDALSVPLLNGATIVYVMGYLLWIQPTIAVLAILLYFPQAVIVPITQHTINRLARLRIQAARNLGQFAIRHHKNRPGRNLPGTILINRMYKIRVWIYLRKYALTALGNFLDSLGPIIVVTVGGYLFMQGKTQIGTLVVFISGLAKIADPWDQLINFYRSVSNTAVMYDMINTRLKNTEAGDDR